MVTGSEPSLIQKAQPERRALLVVGLPTNGASCARLDGQPVDEIYADLTAQASSVNSTSASSGLCCT